MLKVTKNGLIVHLFFVVTIQVIHKYKAILKFSMGNLRKKNPQVWRHKLK